MSFSEGDHIPVSWCLCFNQSSSVVSASHWPSLQALTPVILLLLWQSWMKSLSPPTSHFLKLLASTYSLIRLDIVWCSLLLSLQNENARLSWTVFGTPWLEATTAITLPLRLCLSLYTSLHFSEFLKNSILHMMKKSAVNIWSPSYTLYVCKWKSVTLQEYSGLKMLITD